jgi:hypothetical protein
MAGVLSYHIVVYISCKYNNFDNILSSYHGMKKKN